MMVRNISIDAGKYATKVAIKRAEGIQRLSFRTKVDETSANNNVFLSKDNYKVSYNGKNYLVGDAAETVSFSTSKAENIHKVAAYTAIAYLVDNGDVVNIAVGCPMSVYLNAAACKDFKDFIFPEGETITITVNETTKSFVIGKVVVLPESSGVIFLDIVKFTGKTVAVIDIGGLNANCAVFKNLSPVLSAVFTTNLGSNVMMEELEKKLNAEFSVQIPKYLMDQIIKDGYIKKDPEASAKLIHDYKLEHVRKIMNECRAKGWDFDTMNIIFVGGTSLGLKKEILEVFPYVDETNLTENATFTNAEGFLKFLLGQAKAN